MTKFKFSLVFGLTLATSLYALANQLPDSKWSCQLTAYLYVDAYESNASASDSLSGMGHVLCLSANEALEGEMPFLVFYKGNHFNVTERMTARLDASFVLMNPEELLESYSVIVVPRAKEASGSGEVKVILRSNKYSLLTVLTSEQSDQLEHIFSAEAKDAVGTMEFSYPSYSFRDSKY